VSGSNPVLLREFSIPMPMPTPIPTRAARVCRAGCSSAWGLGGFEALRLIRFVFRGVLGLWRSDRMLVFVGRRESVAPAGAWCSWGG
jgi:hypothetical protein